MKKFYHPVDLSSREAMVEYLSKHFRYDTMHHWNQSTSYACNLKVDRLGLNAALVDKLMDMLETYEFQAAMQELRDCFGEEHHYQWQAGMNGRSGGYLVLYQGYAKPSEYKSFCLRCGQCNYKSVTESGFQCGRCGKDTRVDYDHPPLQIGIYPGRGTDGGEDYEDWNISELRERVRLVQELDQLADAMVAEALELARSCRVEEEEYFVPKKGKFLVNTA